MVLTTKYITLSSGFSMNRPKSLELPTYAVLVSSSGQILDVKAHHLPEASVPSELKGRKYADQCSPPYHSAIRGLLARQRSLLSAVMSPPTLGLDAWFAVVGVPLGASKEGGALFVHMDISPWVTNDAKTEVPKEISMDLLHKAMATTFMGEAPVASKGKKAREYYDGVDSLSKRQLEVLNLIGTGKSNSEIAEELSCSLNTVKRHVTAVLQKLKLPNRTKAAMLINQFHRTSGHPG